MAQLGRPKSGGPFRSVGRRLFVLRISIGLFALLAALVALSTSAKPSPASEPPSPPRAPLLYVQVKVPPGYTVSFLSRAQATAPLKTPHTVGLKPGYGYWLRLRPADGNGESVYPLIEVLDTLAIPARLKAWDLPVPVAITENDLLRLHDGKLVSKVVVAEYDPSTLGDAPELAEWPRLAEDENEVPPPKDVLREASRFGRPLLVLRLGNRQLEPQEWSQPPLPLTAGSLVRAQNQQRNSKASGGFDCPATAGSIRDGGDFGQPAHRTPEGQLGGLEPGDAVAEFADSAGRRKLAVANPVYLVAPRFLTFYQASGVGRLRSDLGLRPVIAPVGREVIAQTQAPGDTRSREEVERLQSRAALQANQTNLPPLRVVASQELSATRLDVPGTRVVAVPLTTESVMHLQCDPCGDPQRQPLRLQKWASTQTARSGEVVTFYLRYCNTSSRPIRDIAIVDNLSPRLEYVPGSARSDREAVFVLQENAVGGRVLRWEIRDPLPPGAQGTVSFQVRVR